MCTTLTAWTVRILRGLRSEIVHTRSSEAQIQHADMAALLSNLISQQSPHNDPPGFALALPSPFAAYPHTNWLFSAYLHFSFILHLQVCHRVPTLVASLPVALLYTSLTSSAFSLAFTSNCLATVAIHHATGPGTTSKHTAGT